jgi:pyruvate,water dikinase
LARAFSRLDRDVPAFRARLDAALGSEGAVLDAWRADELVAHWRTLEARLLSRWDVPLVNDLAAMIAHGLARSLMARWAGDTDGGLTSAIIASGDALASAEPARRINELGRAAAHDRELVDVLVAGSTRDVARALATRPSARDAIAAYIATWGDRCLDELKLETETLADDPLPLYRAIGWAARNARSSDPATSTSAATATARLDAAVRGHPIRRAVLRRVLASARARIEARETLRLERTRLFGRVRRVFLALGARLRDAGRLATPRDVFWLEVDEVLGAIDGTATTSDLRGLVAIRRAEFATWRTMPRPPARCVTRGIVHEAMHRGVWEAPARNSTATMVDVDADGKIMRRGTPAFPGIVRGRARVITDPRGASLATGDILVAERTDPGWVLLFPAARAVVVERGSLLSHSAIVARELGLPAIVGVPGLTSWLTDGETIEIDGALGTVRRIAEASDAE